MRSRNRHTEMGAVNRIVAELVSAAKTVYRVIFFSPLWREFNNTPPAYRAVPSAMIKAQVR